MSLPRLQLLSRRDCCLCDEAKPAIAAAAAAGLCDWEVVDVDRDKGLLVRYGNEVPVVLIDGEEWCRHRVDGATLQTHLKRVVDERQ